MSEERFTILYHRYVADTLSVEEWREWKQLFADDAYASLFARLVGETATQDFLVTTEERGNPDLMFRAITGTSNRPQAVVTPRRIASVWLKYAAFVMLVLGGAWYIWQQRSHSNNTVTGAGLTTKTSSLTDEKPVLILADGTVINLDSAQSGLLAAESGSAIHKTADGIRYSNSSFPEGPLAMNTVRTPKGRQYQIGLPDGSRVWLNAYTSIRFPAVFPRGKRQVEVKGEAYFEIAPDKSRPFTVDLGSGKSVEVLGTSFNVNNYADEPVPTATVIEGSVRVKAPENAIVLQKNETVNILETCQRNGVDPHQQIAWKSGIFSFHGTDTRALLRQISRWYDVEIVYQNNVALKFFEGKMGRDLSLAQIQKILRDFGIANSLQGNKLIIK